jgi:hypothetical protein
VPLEIRPINDLVRRVDDTRFGVEIPGEPLNVEVFAEGVSFSEEGDE